MLEKILLYAHKKKKQLIRFSSTKKSEWKYKKYLVSPIGKKVYVIGTPEHINVGDSAIVIAEKTFVEKAGVENKRIKEITQNEYINNRHLIKKCIKENFLICFHGGGNMGDQWLHEEVFRREVIDDFKKNPVIIFPQTIYYTDSVKGKEEQEKSIPFYNQQRMTIVAREKKSYIAMKELYPNANILLTPDIVLSCEDKQLGLKQERTDKALLCLRHDPEKALTDTDVKSIKCALHQKGVLFDVTDMYSDVPANKENRYAIINVKLKEFAKSKFVITDRLHGMIFAAITSTPCIVFGNYNQKVKGTYEWISSLPYIFFLESVEELNSTIDKVCHMGIVEYDNQKWLEKYEPLAERIKEYVCD